MGLFYYLRSGYAKKESVHLMCYNSLLELIITREQELSMALFGRKKKDEEKGAKSSENKQSNNVTQQNKGEINEDLRHFTGSIRMPGLSR